MFSMTRVDKAQKSSKYTHIHVYDFEMNFLHYLLQSSLMASSSQLHELSTSEDKSARLKGAFLMACSGNIVSLIRHNKILFI